MITDRIFTYTNGFYNLPEFSATNAMIDVLALTTVITLIALYNGPKVFWVGSIMNTKRYKNHMFFNFKAPVWRPYFKKDGYFGIFTENTLWA